MNLFVRVAAVISCVVALRNNALPQAVLPPFSIELEEVTWPEWPGLHSFAIGEWDGRWVLATGRSGGLHGFLPPDPFSVTEANRFIYLFDPATGEQWSKSIFSLPDDIADQLRSTNAEYFQRGQYLYIMGGYGKDTAVGSFITFPSLLAIDLEMLSEAIIEDEDMAPAIRKMEDTIFCVTGGEATLFNNEVYLFGGHIFTGDYTKPATPSFTQEYTNGLKKFLLNDDGADITITDFDFIKDTAAFHRRDLNFEPVVFPDETFGLAAFSGVFQYEADWVWFNPVYFTDDGYTLDETFSQQLNNYTCPVITLYDSVEENYYATFFGGIGQYHYDEENDTIRLDMNVPFVNDISTIIRYADGTTEQMPMPLQFDALLGSNMAFVPDDAMPHYENGVIRLHDIDGDVFAGYLFGGIDALFANFTPSTASNRLFKVFIHYEQPVGIIDPAAPEINIYPNPAAEFITIQNKTAETINAIRLINTLGETVWSKRLAIAPGFRYQADMGNISRGIYFLMLEQKDKKTISKLVIE